MRCGECKGPVSKTDLPRATMVRDDAGRLKEVLHKRCKIKRDRAHRAERVHTAYDEAAEHRTRTDFEPEEVERRTASEEAYAAMRRRREEIDAQRDLEPTPGQFDDWREPETLDIEDIAEMSQGSGKMDPPESDEEST